MTSADFMAKWGPRVAAGSCYPDEELYADLVAVTHAWFEEGAKGTREHCAKIAERVAGYYSKNNGDNKDVAFLVAKEIREDQP